MQISWKSLTIKVLWLGTLVFAIGQSGVNAGSMPEHPRKVQSLVGSTSPNLPISIPGNLPIEVITPEIRKAYIPLGFDDNDIAQFVVEGQFPDNCYTSVVLPPTIDTKAKRIYFNVAAYRFKGPCADSSKTAWMQVIDVPDFLQHGNYGIYRQSGDMKDPEPAQVGILKIAHTDSSRRDDFVYAPVSSFYLKSPKGSANRKIVLIGNYENNCTELDLASTKMSLHDSVVVIQPVTKKSARKNCEDAETSFVQEIDIPASIPMGRYLFHIRTKDGHSFNRVSYLAAGH